ncbi:asparaginase [Anianabacter salinae]|uniref:asparaginase n=1 Tax=Anianabacter salinae TaxID=2851023 RepID=UPI00225E2C6F|nr:asparaginase [Anianabacter salinae]MBV0913395.1 asparaginase [Anianabacter salinae]
MSAVELVEVWRGDMIESRHRGHAVICGPTGEIEEAWGDPDAIIYPRSSCKMLQALPLIESGAADAHGLTTKQLALACASHQGAAIHSEHVTRWLSDLGLSDDDLRCGPEDPRDRSARDALIRDGGTPCQYHNNCSGKHCGFLTLTRHLGAGPEYVALDHPVQQAARDAFEAMTGMDSPGHGIDGCSAPNFATSLHGLARAMARFAAATEDGTSARNRAAARLTTAMAMHPELVAGEGRACTSLMRAMGGRAAVKTGAEAFFIAILPDLKKGIAVKIEDGATRASEAVIAALLARVGAIEADHPAIQALTDAPLVNRRGVTAGHVRAAQTLRA